ncbi:hypothetical protein [Caulobacter sp. 17J80-11]|uniref:hypothetical protein n=1 Tax=Caulobacter sp. 17J80-11 TaxID=2763502 RepID=UPI001653B63F|nr:hypothetical protein [Caulobacter sp. 17J80-11]MBC6983435.1 hypothetical protein [Caulobacter sp. 17J80-11]
MRWLLTIGVLAAAGWWLARLASAVPPDALEPPGVSWTMYDCDGDRRFAARLGEAGTEVWFPNGEHAVIPDGGSRPYAGGMLSVDGPTTTFAKGGARIDCETRSAALEIELGPPPAPAAEAPAASG